MASNQAPKSEGEPPYDLATCRQFLLANGERVVYAPDHVQWKESKKAFVGKTVRWNPDKSTAGTLKTRIARELLDDEKSSEISWDGPTENSPAALYRLRGTWEEGLYTRPYDPTAPRWILPRRPVAPLPPRDDPVFADACKRLDLANCRQFLLSNLHRVVYAPEDLQTRIEHQDLDFVGKKLNWITEYWTMDKSFPSVQRELYGEEKSTVFSPAGPDVDKPTSPYKLDGSIRTGLFVRVDQGKPPPTQEQRDIFDVDLTACREFLMDNGVHVLYIGGTADIRNRAVNQDFTDKEVRFNSISGETSTPRIVRELQGSEKTPVLSKGEPSEDNPTHPYLLRGTLNSLYTNPHTPRTLLDDAQARRVASANEDFDRFYAASSKRSDVSSCREFLLSNGERVIYVPKTVSLGDKYRDESFEGVELHWNPDREMLGQKKVYVVREVEEGERSAVRSPDGPTADMPSAPHLLTGTINGGLHTLPPRYPLRLTAPPSSEVIPAGELGAQDAGRLFPVICSTSIPAEVSSPPPAGTLQKVTDHPCAVQRPPPRRQHDPPQFPGPRRKPNREIPRRVQPRRQRHEHLFTLPREDSPRVRAFTA